MKKRFEEDLIELLPWMGQTPGTRVTLKVKTLRSAEKLI
tara:strand:- start:906 stop:1022 length:117 start_codon:yes stop_codon:yes gene_type:complete